MRRAILLVALMACGGAPLGGYSVLTHEAIIDTAWDQQLRPLLLARYPSTTTEELRKAHAFAYGGCLVQDMGYYPFGNKFFSDLLHYVRSGDFVVNLLAEAHDVNEYAFALGALAHYAADTQGHSIAVNRSVPIEYPKLRAKYGDLVTYEDNPKAHIKVEFSFDVLQVARGNYASDAYHDFIGFEVADDLLARAFQRTYSLELKSIFSDLDLALGTYRYAVSSVVPSLTKVAWETKKDELSKRGVVQTTFVYRLSRAGYRKEWGTRYREPGIGIRILAFLIRILPKVGPLSALKFKPPGPQSDKYFQDSFVKTLDLYQQLLAAHRDGRLHLENRDFDTGKLTKPTEYRMADDAYSKLAIKVADLPNGSVDPAVRADILAYYSDPELPYATKKDKKDWEKTLKALDVIRLQASPISSTSK